MTDASRGSFPRDRGLEGGLAGGGQEQHPAPFSRSFLRGPETALKLRPPRSPAGSGQRGFGPLPAVGGQWKGLPPRSDRRGRALPSALTLRRLLHAAVAPLPCGAARSTASSSSSPSHAARAPPLLLLLLPLKAQVQARSRIRAARAEGGFGDRGRAGRSAAAWGARATRGTRRSEQRQRLHQQPPSRRCAREERRAAAFGLPRRPHGLSPQPPSPNPVTTSSGRSRPVPRAGRPGPAFLLTQALAALPTPPRPPAFPGFQLGAL
jgi:hypothetical protein